MDTKISEMIDVELSLSGFNLIPYYNASVSLFKALGYTIRSSDMTVDVDINEFIYMKWGNQLQYSLEELHYLHSASSISVLFYIDQDDIYIKTSRNIGFFSKILFLAVELNCSKKDRSKVAHFITKILNKVFANALFILYYHDGHIIFSSQLYDDIQDELSGKVYLSDWYKCYAPPYEITMKLCELSYSNFCCHNIRELYCDMIYTMAREYYWTTGSYKDKIFDYIDYKNYLSDEGNYKRKNLKSLFSKLKYKHMYGDDYVDEKESIDLLLPESEEWLFNDLIADDAEYMSDEVNKDDDNITEEDVYDLPEGLDEALFDDPVKLLEWLDDEQDI